MTDQQPPQQPPSTDTGVRAYDDLRDLTGVEPIRPLEDAGIPTARPPGNPLVVGLLLAALLVVVSVTLFQLLRPGDDPAVGETQTTTTAAAATDGTVSVAPESTETPDETTTTTTSIPEIEPEGDPIAIEELTLAVNGIGPISFGTRAELTLGRFAASLGPADSDTGVILSTGEFGSCPGVEERVVTWGPLSLVMNRDSESVLAFAGYRLDLSEGAFISPASELRTLSGLGAGDSVGQMKEIYSSFRLDFIDDLDHGKIFELRGTESDALLLWGPVTEFDDEAQVLGIYSPDPCNA